MLLFFTCTSVLTVLYECSARDRAQLPQRFAATRSAAFSQICTKWGPWFVFVLEARSLPLLSKLASWPQHNSGIRREKRDGANFAVIDGGHWFLSKQDIDTTGGIKQRRRLLLPAIWLQSSARKSKLSVWHSLTLTDTFLCPCFTFRKVGGGSLTIKWECIVCNNHWESRYTWRMSLTRCLNLHL